MPETTVPVAFSSRKEAREAAWFSRRHVSRDEHDAAREAYLSKRGRRARQARALKRASR